MWNTTEETPENGNEFENEVVIKFKDEELFVDAGDNFVQEIIGAARDWGIGKFKVVLNGDEIENEEAPAVFEAGDIVTLVKFEDPA